MEAIMPGLALMAFVAVAIYILAPAFRAMIAAAFDFPSPSSRRMLPLPADGAG